ncbi:MAG TPA: TIGR03617 family F420-dependent LLM class oxidoreductase [Streptosporangiaceae bacterium]|jgi:probable F420-dependent oxidoreductase|nr:TIGR03617 family F420-dependent LLM class oxidoreductase [Streptosporangiaceae bacterium]
MQIDSGARVSDSPADIEVAAAAAEAAGYDGFSVPETRHDAFVSLALAARATERIGLQSSIAVAFARNPMNVAVLANDIQLISAGRFDLGLGSQVRPHIERRYSMPWSHPAARMEEFIAAIRAIWHSWETGDRLAFRGTFYQHTLMTDFFNPGPNPHGNPAVLLAAVGERMTAVAGRAADGILCHSFTTEAYLRERTIPALREARGSLDGFTISLPVLVVLGGDEKARAAAEAGVREQIAFYGSTPAYRPVLDLHGWGELHEQLNLLSRRQEWTAMGRLITDDVLSAFAVSGDAAAVAAGLIQRFGDVITRVSLYTPYQADPAAIAGVTADLRAAA